MPSRPQWLQDSLERVMELPRRAHSLFEALPILHSLLLLFTCLSSKHKVICAASHPICCWYSADGLKDAMPPKLKGA